MVMLYLKKALKLHLNQKNMNPADVTVEALVASEQFQNYCRKTNEADIAYWEKWLKANPTYLLQVEQARQLVLALATEISDEEVTEAFFRFKQAVKKEQKTIETKLYPVTRQTRTNSSKRRWLSLAVTFLLLIAFGIWKLFLSTPISPVLLATKFGEIQTHFLPDGSKVILNANSSLSFNKNWQTNTPRQVQLSGEAFFEIKKRKASEKFTVQTDNGAIEVLGTSFNVLQRASAFEVALLEGTVALTIPKYPIIKMEPGELVRVDGTDFFDRQSADVDAFSAWRFQRMVFKETPIGKVIQRLQNEFDWKVSVANQDLLKRKITATIPKNDPELLLQALSEIYDLKIEKMDDQTYIIE